VGARLGFTTSSRVPSRTIGHLAHQSIRRNCRNGSRPTVRAWSHPVFLDRRNPALPPSDPMVRACFNSEDVNRTFPTGCLDLDRYTCWAARADARVWCHPLKSDVEPCGACGANNQPLRFLRAAQSRGEDVHGLLTATGSNLSSVCFCDWHERRLKLANGSAYGVVDLVQGTRVIVSSITPDGLYIAFSVRQHGKALVRSCRPTERRSGCDRFTESAGRSCVCARRQSITSAANDARRPTSLPRGR